MNGNVEIATTIFRLQSLHIECGKFHFVTCSTVNSNQNSLHFRASILKLIHWLISMQNVNTWNELEKERTPTETEKETETEKQIQTKLQEQDHYMFDFCRGFVLTSALNLNKFKFQSSIAFHLHTLSFILHSAFCRVIDLFCCQFMYSFELLITLNILGWSHMWLELGHGHSFFFDFFSNVRMWIFRRKREWKIQELLETVVEKKHSNFHSFGSCLNSWYRLLIFFSHTLCPL